MIGRALILLALTGACQPDRPVYRPNPDPGPPPPRATGSAAAAAKPTPRAAASPATQEARQVWATRCAACHGAQGRGDGPAARMLGASPKSFAAPGWQSSTTDERIAKAIVEGGAAVGLSASMPASPDLASQPDLVRALVGLIRGFEM